MREEPRPSATVVVIRDAEGLEVLLLQRNTSRRAWVFPGGKVDAGDLSGADPRAEDVARNTAVRESREEAGLVLDAAKLVPISRWITPEVSEKRFDTLFFAARVAPAVEVVVDGGEIASHRWFGPAAALAAHHAREIRLAPPTFVTVSWLSEHAGADEALDALSRQQLLTFRPRIHSIKGGACILYPGDAGYDVGDVELPGARHRLWALPDGWRYERAQAAARPSGV